MGGTRDMTVRRRTRAALNRSLRHGGRGTADILVASRKSGDGWVCDVRVVAERTRTRHGVRVSGKELSRLDPGAPDPARLVRASFEFLLEREPSESILRQFELTEINRYFPDYETEIRRRLTA
jgi:hypothetical protein